MFRSQTIAAWTSDFLETVVYKELPPVREYAQEILPAFLERACAGLYQRVTLRVDRAPIPAARRVSPR